MDGVIAPTRHKLDVNAYHRMGEAGIFGDSKRIELIEGDLIDMSPIGQVHASIVGSFNEVFVTACAGRALVWPQGPLRLDPFNEPQPDLAILRRRPDFYAGKMPGPEDVLLLVEVADSSLRFDRTVKLPLYARAGIAELWIVDVSRRTVDIHRKPAGSGYLETVSDQASGEIALALAPEIVIRLDRVFGAMI
jgi:Uma2 family endonuclease